jgi:hypothetical protein
MKIIPALLVMLSLSACSAMPSMQYCQQVEYTRTGNKISLHAECAAPIGSNIPGL